MSKVIVKALLNYLAPIVLSGLIGGLLVGAFFVWPAVYGAKWWDALTALGTVGAVTLVLFQDLFKREKSKRRLQGASRRFAKKIEFDRRRVWSILRHRADTFEMKSQKIRICLLGLQESIPQAIIDDVPCLAAYIHFKVGELMDLSQGGNTDSMSDYSLTFNEFKSRYSMEMQELSMILEGALSL